MSWQDRQISRSAFIAAIGGAAITFITGCGDNDTRPVVSPTASAASGGGDEYGPKSPITLAKEAARNFPEYKIRSIKDDPRRIPTPGGEFDMVALNGEFQRYGLKGFYVTRFIEPSGNDYMLFAIDADKAKVTRDSNGEIVPPTVLLFFLDGQDPPINPVDKRVVKAESATISREALAATFVIPKNILENRTFVFLVGTGSFSLDGQPVPGFMLPYKFTVADPEPQQISPAIRPTPRPRVEPTPRLRS